MIVPTHWAEASLKKRVNGRQITVKRFGWSDVSVADAQRMADDRAAEAMAEIEAGHKLDRRELKRAYNGADGVPIREEIVHRYEDTIITRNSYGALCLNTPDVVFADVDVGAPPMMLHYLASAAVFLPGPVYVVAKHPGWLTIAVFLVFAALAIPPLARMFSRIGGRISGKPTIRARNAVAGFSRCHPDWRIRLYETPAGFRLLVMHQTFTADDPVVQEFFQQIGADPMYVRMCQRQNCFRARVSPKPWRIGYRTHLKPRPGVWPIKPERLPDRRRWIKGYDELAKGFASCRFVEEFGNAPVDPKAEQVRSLHDSFCRSHTDLPIA